MSSPVSRILGRFDYLEILISWKIAEEIDEEEAVLEFLKLGQNGRGGIRGGGLEWRFGRCGVVTVELCFVIEEFSGKKFLPILRRAASCGIIRGGILRGRDHDSKSESCESKSLRERRATTQTLRAASAERSVRRPISSKERPSWFRRMSVCR